MKKRYNISIDSEIHDNGVKVAGKQRDTFSKWLENLIYREVKKDEKTIQKHS